MTDGLLERGLVLSSDPGWLQELAQIRAKATLTEVLGTAPAFRWRYEGERVVRNLALLHVALERSDVNGDPRIGEAARVAAQAWESLAAISEHVHRPTALMNASLQYEIAGFQANAVCVARMAADRKQWTTNPTAVGVASAFAQRLFIRTRLLGASLRTAPVEGANDADVLRRLSLSLAADALDHASRHFLSGDDREYLEAMDKLGIAYRALQDAALLPDANLVAGLRSLLPQMRQRSTWRSLGERAPGVPRWTRYLRVLARGLGSNVIDSRSISELWPSQLHAVENGLLDAEGSMVIRMPTSAGKTRVAEMAIVHTLTTRPGSRALYVAPFRALVNEVTESFSNLFTDLGLAATSIVGAYEQDDVQQLSAEQDRLLVLTPEKLNLLLRLEPTIFDGVEVVALDEGQLAGDPTRGAAYELLVTRLRRRLPTARFLMLSAVVPDQTLADFAAWMRADHDRGIVTTQWRPATQRVAALEWQGGRGVLRYVRGEGQAGLARFVPGLIEEQSFEFVNPATGRLLHRRFPGTSKSQVAAAVAWELAPRGPVLVFCAQTNWARDVGTAFLTRINYAEVTGEAIPGPFRSTLDRPEPVTALAVAREWLGEASLVARLLERGIGLHYGRLPDPVREAIEEDFRARCLDVLIATSTLAQGVNLPVRTVIFHSCWRVGATTQTRLSAREYWNIAGRAGRAGEETEGSVIHLVLSPNDRRDLDFYLGRRRSVEEVESALFAFLQQLIADRISPEAVGEALDSEILAILAEEGAEDLTTTVAEILDGSLCRVQAERKRVPMQSLAGAMEAAATRIATQVTDPNLRRTYSATGLSTNSCESIRDHISHTSDELVANLAQVSPESQRAVMHLIVDGLAGVREMSDANAYHGDLSGLIDRWVDGLPVADIAGALAGDHPEELAFVIEQVLTYLLPWGSSAYLRIAKAVLAVDIPPSIGIIPALLKYGVPNSEAAWIQGAGIRSRQLSIDLAHRYNATELQRGPEAVRRWLSRLNPDDLINEFGVQPSVAASAARAILRSTSSELLDLYEAGALFPRSVTIQLSPAIRAAGVPDSVRPGSDLVLTRDYLSPISRNSVAVEASGLRLGYLPHELSRVLALEIDSGRRFGARVAVEVTELREDTIIVDLTEMPG